MDNECDLLSVYELDNGMSSIWDGVGWEWIDLDPRVAQDLATLMNKKGYNPKFADEEEESEWDKVKEELDRKYGVCS